MFMVGGGLRQWPHLGRVEHHLLDVQLNELLFAGLCGPVSVPSTDVPHQDVLDGAE